MTRKLTELRKEILEIIDGSEFPLQVKEINSKLSKDVNITSIYRSLEFLEERGHIQAISFNTNVRYFFSNVKRNGHFLFCCKCNNIQCFGGCFASDMQKPLEREYGFKINDHFLYFTGVCQQCRELAHEGRF